MIQLRRIEVLCDTTLIAQVVGLTLVFGQPARNGFGVAYDGTRHERQVLRIELRSPE